MYILYSAVIRERIFAVSQEYIVCITPYIGSIFTEYTGVYTTCILYKANEYQNIYHFVK